jgi:putative nucleotidyltransferase with HDIG domain
MDAWTLRNQIERIDNLPTIPAVLKRLLELIEDPNISLQEIGNFILKDPALTTRILKVVNSPIYGFPGRISTVSQALILLGLNVVKGLLLGVSVFDVMQKVMAGLWEHSVGCAITSRIIAQKRAPAYLEEISVAALLHDIGKVVLGMKFPDKYKKAVSEAEKKDIFISEAEKKIFETTHASVGAWLIEKWNFPKNISEVIEYHQKPNLSKNFPLQTSVVHVSNVLIRAKGFGFSGDNIAPPINPFAWETLNLTEDDIRDILAEMEESLEHASDIALIAI